MPAEEGETTEAAPSAADLQRRVLDYWDRTGLPDRAVAGRAGGVPFRFSEGPPTANGVPHIGHVVARAVKDVQLRYRRMSGRRIVTPMAGWDCHGLPVELEIEKRHGLKSKKEIEAYGVEKFCEECRASVFEAVNVWREMSRRMGYWLDYDHPYITMNAPYIESVWWSLKALFDRHSLEKGYYVLPYCPRCETPLSSHEVAQGYRETTDPSVTVRFRVRVEGPADSPRRYLLVWTTTPWTLPSNLLIAARGDLDYVAVRAADGEEYLLADAAREHFQQRGEVVGRWKGTELLGLEYEPLFPFAGPAPGRYRVVLDDMVEAKEGTGFVHIAPSFGPDDQRIGEREGVGMFDPLDARAHFTDLVPPVAGKQFKAADPILLDSLRASGALVQSGHLRHTYPYCWRCDHALIYRAMDSWFVRTSRFTEALVRNNSTVSWIPAHLRDGRFGNFLTEAKDWALSRNRYWGTPLPVWRCGEGHVTCIGSFAELAERYGQPLPVPFDPHRVTVDRIAFACPTCGGRATREPYTIDGWYDSGCAPFAAYHYPFEPGPFESGTPLDFISEGLDQTRGWFYTLLVLATTLFDRPAYKVCVSTGLVLDESGRKMSKSKGNAIEPLALLAAEGGDAVRWAFLVNDYTEPLRLDEGSVRRAAARTIGTVVHVAQFFLANARADQLEPAGEPPTSDHLLDRWLLSRLDGTAEAVTASLESYDPRPGALALREFVDDLSTWYLRRSRPRFWSDEASSDRRAAHETLSFTLQFLARLLAPYAPFTAEYLAQEVGGGRYLEAERSVHFATWPAPLGRRDATLEAAMADLREAVEVGRELRQRAGVKSRIPLPTLIQFAASPSGFESLGPAGLALLTEELNVGEFHRLPQVAAAEYTDPEYVRREHEGTVTWALSRTPTPELRREGLVRETLRRLQLARKELGLRYVDRVDVDLVATGALRDAVASARDRIARDLLADRLTLHRDVPRGEEGWREWSVDEFTLSARLRRRASS